MAIVINGSGTVTGLAVGGLPDGTVDAGTLATNSVDSAELIDGAVDRSHLATGIDDNSNATAITINSSEQVGVGLAAPSETLHVYKTSSADAGLVNVIKVQTDTNNSIGDGSAIAFHGKYNSTEWGFGKIGGANSGSNWGGALEFHTNAGNNSSPSIAYTKQLTITQDGRGLSQFTAKAWVNFNGESTLAIRDSHNVSSVTDNSAGDYTVNFSNNMGNANYAFSGGAGSANSGMRVVVQPFESYPPAVGSCRFNTTYVHGSVSDSRIACVTIFGD